MGQSAGCSQADMVWDSAYYHTCRAAACIQGLFPTVVVLCFSVARFLVYFSLCEETSKDTVCRVITEYNIADYSTKGVTFYLLFSVAGLIFCVINSVINLLLFYNQSKGILGSWFTWTFLCAIGQFVWSFQQVWSLVLGFRGILWCYEPHLQDVSLFLLIFCCFFIWCAPLQAMQRWVPRSESGRK